MNYISLKLYKIRILIMSNRFTENSKIELHFTKNKKGMLVLSDQEIINSQKGVVKEIMSQAIKSWSFRKGFTGFSLPAKIFSPLSQMEFIPRMFGNIHFLYDAFNALKPDEKEPMLCKAQRLERLKYILSFIYSGFYHAASESKPFNPLLGESFQGYYDDGTEICIEHINHSPPMDSFYICNSRLGFKIYGTLISGGTIF